MVSVFRPPHTLLNESFRLQFPFVFRRLQSLQLLLPAHPCHPLSLPAFSGLPLSRPSAASASLSDPRCFRFLSVASVLGSDYSASVSSFPASSCLCLTVASSVLRPRFRSFGLPRSFPPGFPCVPSRFSVLSDPVCFLSPFPDSLPQLFLRCSLSRFPLPLRILSSASLPLPATQPAVSSVPFFPFLPHSGFPGAPLSLSFLRFSPFSPA